MNMDIGVWTEATSNLHKGIKISLKLKYGNLRSDLEIYQPK